ncbi:MAG: ribonuclease H-like domain-containing protein [Candidatus Woesearchaeota archaeon]
MEYIFDIETAPLKPGEHTRVTEQNEVQDIGGLSPVTGKIIAIGLLHQDKPYIFTGHEKTILTDFWQTLKTLADSEKGYVKLIGFNIKQFDIHFLLVRSLAHKIAILPFTRRQVIDLRDYLTFFHTYMKKGTLNDYARIIGIDGKHDNIQNSDIPKLYENGDIAQIKKYVEQDIKITAELYKACKEIGILNISY